MLAELIRFKTENCSTYFKNMICIFYCKLNEKVINNRFFKIHNIFSLNLLAITYT